MWNIGRTLTFVCDISSAIVTDEEWIRGCVATRLGRAVDVVAQEPGQSCG